MSVGKALVRGDLTAELDADPLVTAVFFFSLAVFVCLERAETGTGPGWMLAMEH